MQCYFGNDKTNRNLFFLFDQIITDVNAHSHNYKQRTKSTNALWDIGKFRPMWYFYFLFYKAKDVTC